MSKQVSDRLSSQERGHQNVTALRDWVRDTPTVLVPVNQFNKASRSRVCAALGIPPSTIRTNKDIKALFVELDTKISTTTYVKPHTKERIDHPLLQDVLAENQRLTRLLSRERARHEVLRYLENNAILVVTDK